jgi:hypothetical protein
LNVLDTVIASLGGSRLKLGGLLERLQAQKRLGPLVREPLVRQYLLDRAARPPCRSRPRSQASSADE